MRVRFVATGQPGDAGQAEGVTRASNSCGLYEGSQMVESGHGLQARSRIRRAAYSATALAVVGGIVAVLGAPMKWMC